MSDQEAIAAAAADAVADLIHKIDEGAFALRYVLLIEVTDKDGDRPLWICAPPDAKPTDSLGLLMAALQIEQAATVADYMGETDG